MITVVFPVGKDTLAKENKLVIKNKESFATNLDANILSASSFSIHLISRKLLIHPNVALFIYLFNQNSSNFSICMLTTYICSSFNSHKNHSP